MVIPDIKVELLKTVGIFTVGKEPFVVVLFLILLEDVDGQNDGASGDHGRLVVQEFGLVQLELADLESHILNGFVCVIVEYPKIPLHRLHRSWEVEIEAHLDKYLGLKVYEGLFAHVLFFLIGKKIYHSGKTWGYWLFQFCGHQNADGRQRDHLGLGEVLGSDHVDISVQNSGGDEKSLLLVLFFMVEVKYLLDSIRPIVGCDLLLNVLLFMKGVLDLLGQGELLASFAALGYVLQVVAHLESVLEGSES